MCRSPRRFLRIRTISEPVGVGELIGGSLNCDDHPKTCLRLLFLCRRHTMRPRPRFCDHAVVHHRARVRNLRRPLAFSRRRKSGLAQDVFGSKRNKFLKITDGSSFERLKKIGDTRKARPGKRQPERQPRRGPLPRLNLLLQFRKRVFSGRFQRMNRCRRARHSNTSIPHDICAQF